jgi:thioesterase domain-containing protein
MRRFAEGTGLSVDEAEASGFWQLNVDEQLRWVLERARRAGLLPPVEELAALRRQFRVFAANVQAMRRWRPGTYSGQVTLFAAADHGSPSGDPAAGWREVAAHVVLRRVPGSHHTMLREPHVDILARELVACLERASASPAVPVDAEAFAWHRS